MKKSFLGALVGVLVLVGGLFFFFRQSPNDGDVLPASVTEGMSQELNDGDTLGVSDDELAQDANSLADGERKSSAPSGSNTLFVAEESELDAEISGLESDFKQLNDQEAQSDLNDLQQVQ